MASRFDLLEGFRESVPFDLEFVTALEVQPEPFAGAKVPSEAKGRVSGDATLGVNDLVDSARWHTNRDRDAVLGDPKRLEILEHQDFAGVDRLKGGCGHVVSFQW
jgi:hypothetical protein